ncbi:MAG TPA: hypothetical protein H9945_07885 [Candidatus Gemmiger avicola]|uniref:Uncharacterized protein n=1 Tax=Candidatus Gemmiger avicola TaxID=2838605 RepID=A0A9D2M7Q2_9FIRM|nr:hypothetical protein [Candidatus Gemmiger avicola]
MQGAKPWNTLNIAYSKVKQRSRRCFLVDLNSAGDFSDTPQAKSQKDRQHIPKGAYHPEKGLRCLPFCFFLFFNVFVHSKTARCRSLFCNALRPPSPDESNKKR